MASLRTEVLSEPVGRQGKSPAIERIIRGLSADERQELIDLMDDASVSGRAICTVLNRRGIEVSEATIYRLRMTGGYRDIA